MTLASPQLVQNNECLDKIHTFLDEFIHKADLRRITHYEMSYLWATLLPYIKLAYIPNTPCSEPVLLSQTQDTALQTIVLSMQSMLAKKIHRKVLVKEGLVDFLTCMPWYTTGPVMERAKAVVRMVRQTPDMDMQPPSLLNMTKACVAKHFCGLPTVFQLSVPEILHHAASD